MSGGRGVEPQSRGTRPWEGALSRAGTDRTRGHRAKGGRDRLRIRGIESGGLIEPEVGLGWGTGGTQQRRPAGKIEVDEDGAYGNGIGDEGDDAHRSTTGRAHERERLIDPGDEGSPSRGSTAAWGGSVRRTRGGLSVELP